MYSRVSEASRRALLAAHIVTAVGVLGADLALLALGIGGLLGIDARAVYPAAHLVASRVIVPLAGGAFGTGILLGLVTSYGLVRYWWVATKLAITVVLGTVVLAVLVPGLQRAAELAMSGDFDVLGSSQRLRYAIAPAVASTLLAFNVVLAVYKPPWRLRRGMRAPSNHGDITA